MIDTHAHLDFPQFDEDREEVISRFFEQGFAAAKAIAGKGKAIINVGVDLEHSRKSIEIAEKHEGIFAAVGLHPEYFVERRTWNVEPDWKNKLRELAKHNKVVAVGECGLDYFHATRNTQHITQEDFKEIKKRQRKGFVMQIEIAKELNLPIIVHCREAWGDLYEIVKSKSLALGYDKFVLHCYSGNKKDTEKFLKLPNVYFSFSGNITYPKPAERAEKLAEAVKMIPLDKIMLDSDAPYLAPQCRRGKRNEPIFVKYIAKKIAEIKGVSEDEVEKKTDKNAMRFFSIGENQGN